MSTLTSRVVAGCARSPAPASISRGGAPGDRVARRRAPHSPSRSSSTTRMSPVRASAGPVDGFVPAIDAAARDVAASTPPLASSSLHRVDPIADVAVDAWSVSGGTTLGVRFAGVETKLFQAGLLPYLVYLYFLGKDEARNTTRVQLRRQVPPPLRLRNHPGRHHRQDKVRRHPRKRRSPTRKQREFTHREQLSIRVWVRGGARGRHSD